MVRTPSSFLGPVLLSLFAAVGCAHGADSTDEDEGAFASDQASLLDFEFDSELVTDADAWNPVEDQLLYTMGHLNADTAVGRLDTVKLTNVVRETQPDGKTKIRYHAKLPVAWGSKTNLPTSYDFKLPRDVSQDGQRTFTERHKDACVDWGAHEVDVGSMWYYYRPEKSGCAIDDAEVIKAHVKVTRSSENTTGKYPEYQKIWEDNRLEVISIFGKYEASATSGDAGIDGFNAFVRTMKAKFAQLHDVKITPANLADDPAPTTVDVSFEGKLDDGKVVKVTALLVDQISEAPPSFDVRYEALSPSADLIAYNGHAGLGQNVRALAQKGHFVSGKYQVFFMNGCDTFAYVDGTLARTRAALNPDDPTGTKYMEFVTNAMPSFFSSMPEASTAIVDGFLSYKQPKTYEQIFQGIDRAEVVLVTGEEDNVFQPGMPIGH